MSVSAIAVAKAYQDKYDELAAKHLKLQLHLDDILKEVMRHFGRSHRHDCDLLVGGDGNSECTCGWGQLRDFILEGYKND